MTFNTRKRNHILDNAAVHEAFILFCTRAYDQHEVAVGRYVLMPDHVHLFVMLPETGVTLIRWLASLKNFIGKSLQAGGVEHPYWQEGFFDHVLRSGESYGQKWEYVRQNPVRAGVSTNPEEWPWKGEIVSLSF